MLNKYRLFQRANGVFYCQNNESSKQRRLRTKDSPRRVSTGRWTKKSDLDLGLNVALEAAFEKSRES